MAEVIMEWLGALFMFLASLSLPIICLYVANETWYASAGRFRRPVGLATGLVGVPIHELAHAAVAKIFGMRVLEVALYKPDPESNSLGYVQYAYKSGSIIHGIGRFFVGIAPVFAGAAVINLLIGVSGLPKLSDLMVAGAPLSFALIQHWLIEMAGQINEPKTVLILALCVMIGSHSTPSKADLYGSAAGIVWIVFLYLISRLIQAWLAVNWDIGSVVESISVYMVALLVQMVTLSAAASLTLSLISLCFLATGRAMGTGTGANRS